MTAPDTGPGDDPRKSLESLTYDEDDQPNQICFSRIPITINILLIDPYKDQSIGRNTSNQPSVSTLYGILWFREEYSKQRLTGAFLTFWDVFFIGLSKGLGAANTGFLGNKWKTMKRHCVMT